MRKGFAALLAMLIPLSATASGHLHALQPVKVSVAAKKDGWIQTISICNISGSPIPFKNLELQFQYSSPQPYTFWGHHGLNWKVSSYDNKVMKLTGGSQVAAPLASDPECKTPMTIVFNADPAQALPAAPFVLLAEGASTLTGNLTVSVPAAPVAGLAAPKVSVSGPGYSRPAWSIGVANGN